jgi:ubiquinone/menaquinone biosynthesis C-methylase UbiE
MGFYSNIILPRILDSAMSGKELAAHRLETLAEAKGEVLEIGFGSGLNLPYYPETVSHITAVDINPGMKKLAHKKIAASSIPVEFLIINGEQLPFKDQSFDAVVSTWTLCSIERVAQALGEIRRVLKADGKFIFIEHGLNPEVKMQKWQHRLNPIQKKLAGNCHLNRSISSLIEGQGFTIEQLKEYYLEKVPRVAGYFYQGFASRS